MIKNLMAAILGKKEYVADIKNGARLINLFREYGLAYYDLCDRDDGTLSFCLTPAAAAAAVPLLKKKGIEVRYEGAWGLPQLFSLYGKRIGILIGAFIASAMVFSADDYVWDIRVTGNEQVTYSRIVQSLAESGFSVGSRIDGLDVDATETEVLLLNDELSWISINMIGTVANVQVREALPPPVLETLRPANIVAKCDGVIEYFEIFTGSPSASVGSAVKKGDLLISGVRDSAVDGVHITRASGKVFAATEREFTVEIPLEYEEKRTVSRKNTEKYLIFFSKEIKIFKNGGKNTPFCDTIDSEEMFSFFGGVRLPFGIRTVSTLESETSVSRYSESEAMELAYYKLERLIETELSEAEIVRKTVYGELTDEAYVLTVKLRCIENIGETVEFDIS